MGTIELKLKALGWSENFLKYVELKKRGLRKAALDQLEFFFLDFRKQEAAKRRQFIDLINTFTFENNEYNTYLPTNMYVNLFLPEIELWEKEEPNNPSPYKWSNEWGKLKKSLELNSNDQITLEKSANCLINKISMNQHEINHGFPYDGNPEADIFSIESFEKYIANIQDRSKQEKISQALKGLKETAIKCMYL